MRLCAAATPQITHASSTNRKDPESDHILLFSSDVAPIGTIRYYPRLGKLGRLAVKKSARGTGAGRLLVLELLQHIKSNIGKSGEYSKLHSLKEVLVVANSQAYAEGFYAKLSFVREGEVFLEVSLRFGGRYSATFTDSFVGIARTVRIM